MNLLHITKAILLSAAVLGCSEKRRSYTEGEIKDAAKKAESIMLGYAKTKDPADIDRLLDCALITSPELDGARLSSALPFIGFLHQAFSNHPERAEAWLARRKEFKGLLMGEAITEAAGFDESNFLSAESSCAKSDYCWGAYHGSGDLRFVREIIKAVLEPPPRGSVDMCQESAAWSLSSFAVRDPSVAKCLNDALKDAPDTTIYMVGRRFSLKERERCFDPGVRMRINAIAPLEM